MANVQPSWAADPVQDANWPQWRGPARDGVSRETGLLKQWPEGGPTLLWTASGCGQGFSSVAIADGLIYTAGNFDNDTFVLALDLNGKLKWKSLNGQKWSVPPSRTWAAGYGGTRSTPTVNDGLVYHLSELGRLVAFDAKTGKEAWAIDITQEFGAKVPNWGYCESALIDGDNLICYPGGPKGYMVALDKKTGKTVWANTTIGVTAAYSSTILAEDRGVRQIITLTSVAVLSVDAGTGKLLWRSEHITTHNNNVNTPIYHNGFVFVSSGYKHGTDALKLTFAGKDVSVEKAWASKDFDNLHEGVILLDGYLYGDGDRKNQWFCVDVKTGEQMYSEKGVGDGSLTAADGMLYCLNDKGTMALVTASPEGFEIVSQFQVPKAARGKYWTHPVVCGKRLYIRHGENLYVYDVEAKGTAPAP